MSKDIEEYYKKYSARITEVDDTPLFTTGTFGSFKMLSTEEYEKLINENKILAKALELACEQMCKFVIPCPNIECGKVECHKNKKDCYLDYFKTKAKEMNNE